MEAPAGLAFQLSLPYAGETRVDPARRACQTWACRRRRARNMNSNSDPLDHRLSATGYRLSKAKPDGAKHELQRWLSRPSAISYWLSA